MTQIRGLARMMIDKVAFEFVAPSFVWVPDFPVFAVNGSNWLGTSQHLGSALVRSSAAKPSALERCICVRSSL